MATAVSSSSSSSSARSTNRDRQAEQSRNTKQVEQKQKTDAPKATAPSTTQTAETEAKRGRVSAEVQQASRTQASAEDQRQRDRIETQGRDAQAPTQVKKGLAAQQTGDAPKVDPKTQPVMVLAPQFGDGNNDEIVKNTYEKVKANAEKNGFNVIDAPNMTGDELREKVKAGVPEGHTGPVVVWTGGHGSVAQDKGETTPGGERKTEHEITASDKDGRSRDVRTGEDVLRPIFDGAREKSGRDPKMTAFVGSCRAGEAANDLTETFNKEEQKSLSVVSSSSRDQLSNGEVGKGVEAATLAFTDMMASDSRTRDAADVNKDGSVSADEFANHVNTEGGGLAVAREKDLDGDQRPDEVQIDSQKVEVAGAGSNPLLPKGASKPGWDPSAGPYDDPNRPTTRAQAMEQAREIQGYLKGIYGQTPKIVDNPVTAGGVDTTYDKGGETSGGVRTNKDGSKVIKDSWPGHDYEEKVQPGGKSGRFSITDTDGTVTEKGSKRYDAQGRLTSQTSTYPNSPWIEGSKIDLQYDDKNKPYSTQVTRQKGGVSITTKRFNDPANQSPWHDNDVASTTEARGPEGLYDRTTEYNRPDTEEGKPYTMSKTEYFDPSTGKVSLSKTVSSSSNAPTAWAGPDGRPLTEAQVRQSWPHLFEQN